MIFKKEAFMKNNFLNNNLLNNNFLKHIILGLSLLSITACGSTITTLQGAGASFPAPIYTKLFADYTTQFTTQVSYQAVGSGSGIQNIEQGIVDFGATDAFMTDQQLAEQKKLGVDILHIPAVLASVNFTYNLPSLKDDILSLDADVIYEIYNGTITHWNDPKIQALNSNSSLPNIKITPVYRSDSSGTTFTFTEFMSKANTNWANTFGTGKTINWSTGIGQKGNSAMMAYTKENIGSISYVDYVYAMQNNFPVAKIKNKNGVFVIGNIEYTRAAAAGAQIPKDTRVSITDMSNAAPMATFSYILVRKEQNYNHRHLKQAQELVKLLQWLYSPEAQASHASLYFTPLPQNVISLGRNIIKQINYNGVPVISTLDTNKKGI